MHAPASTNARYHAKQHNSLVKMFEADYQRKPATNTEVQGSPKCKGSEGGECVLGHVCVGWKIMRRAGRGIEPGRHSD